MVKPALALAGLLFASCADRQAAREALSKAGYTQIVLGGSAFPSCPPDENLSREFTAVNPRGEKVKGAVCCSAFSCSVHF